MSANGAAGGEWIEPDALGLRLVLLDAERSFPALDAALDTGLVAALTAAEPEAELRALCRAHACALLAGSGSDGLLVGRAETVGAERRRLGPKAILGARVGLSRHAAMSAGESGADWVLFGKPEAPLTQALEVAAWWTGLSVLPCGVAGSITPADIAALRDHGVDFAVLPHPVWSDPASLDALVERLRAA